MWLEYVRALWPVVVALSLLISSVFVLWLSSRYVTKAVVDGVTAKLVSFELDLGKHDVRIRQLEDQFASAPTRQELQDDISRLSAEMEGVKTGQLGIQNQLKTTNDYLHTLIENGLKVASGARL